MKNNSELWKLVVSRLQPFFEDPLVLAGGCLRDYVLSNGKGHPKDIDVFANVDNEFDLEIALDKMRDAGYIETADHSPEAQAYKDQMEGPTASGTFITGVLNIRMVDVPFPIQLVAAPMDSWSGQALVDRFDYNLVQIYFTEAEGLVRTAAFNNGVVHKKVVFTSDKPSETSKMRVYKLKAKFPAFFFSDGKATQPDYIKHGGFYKASYKNLKIQIPPGWRTMEPVNEGWNFERIVYDIPL